MDSYDSESYRKFTAKSEFDKALHTLNGILLGIAIDKEINPDEKQELLNWINSHKRILNYNPYREIKEVILNAIQDNILDREEKENLDWLTNEVINSNKYYNVITSDLQRLQGIFHGILADNTITDKEIYALDQWLEENEHLIGYYPYDEIKSLITCILADNIIADEEKQTLKVFFSEFIENYDTSNIDFKEIERLKSESSISAVCTIDPRMEFDGKTFCFTGKSEKSSRKEISEIVESLQGIFSNSISKNTDYLVYGNAGNPCWAFSCYGRKVERAVQLRKDGHHIQIIHENDFWDCVEDYS